MCEICSWTKDTVSLEAQCDLIILAHHYWYCAAHEQLQLALFPVLATSVSQTVYECNIMVIAISHLTSQYQITCSVPADLQFLAVTVGLSCSMKQLFVFAVSSTTEVKYKLNSWKLPGHFFYGLGTRLMSNLNVCVLHVSHSNAYT